MTVLSRRALGSFVPVVLVAATIATAQATFAVGSASDYPTTVGEVPGTNTPNITDGTVYAITQVGSVIVVGGNFTSVTNRGSSTTISRPNILAFDQATGTVSTTFAPSVDGEVDALAPGPVPSTVYAGGTFSNVNGVKSKGVTLLNTQTGAIAGGFKPPSMNGVVQSLALSGNRLFIGGSFSTLGGVPHAGLGTVNATTGALDAYMNVQLAGHHNYNGSGANGRLGPRAIAVNPDGTRLVAVGNFKTADALPRDQAVMIDLDTGSTSVDPNWATEQYTAACYSWAFDTYMTDVQYSADGSYFVITATGGGGTNDDGSNSLCDTASRWASTDTGSNVKPTWVDYTGRDSLWSVAITGAAIYVGGHQRWMNNSYGSDNAQAGAVPRPGIAALDPASGAPLAWDAGRNPRGAGAYALFPASNGLYVGSDTNYFGNFQYKRQKIGLLPLAGGTTTPAATTTEQLPGNLYQAGQLPSSSNTNVLYRVNAGGPTVGAIDNGPDWMADSSNSDPGAQYRNPDNNSATYSCCVTMASSVPSSTPAAIFDSERWDAGSHNDGDEMSWHFPVATGTHVGVRLYFANRYSGTSQPGQRVFDVAIDGNTVLDHYDIVADVGDQTGTMKEFDVTSSGTITISFTHETENPLIDGIELINLDATGGTNTNVLSRVNAGGPVIGALDNGPDWMADSSNSDPGAQYRNPDNNSATYSCCVTMASSVPSSTPAAIFDSERWDGGSQNDGDEMSWHFPVATGTHVGVRLYFANRYSGTSQPGQRVFDVAIDGNTVLNHYDIVADVGDQTGTMKEFDVTSPGTITISFTHETENPLVDGIELINLDAPTGGGGSSGLDTLTRRAVDGTSIGAPDTVTSTIGWGSTRGAFMVGNFVFYADTDGNFYRVPYNGSTFGTPEVLDPYDDPRWDNVQTGSGQTYQGVKPTFFSEIPSVTGAFYSNGRMYYSLLGQPQLFWRWFSPDSGTIGSQEFTQDGANFSRIAGMVLSGTSLYYANRSDGTLHVIPFVAGVPDSSQDATISGPAIDGIDWRSRGMFIHGHANQAPTASATASCTELTCSFNGSGSSDPDGSVDTYAWDFGDGAMGSGVKPSHVYASTGTYHVTLTVTDDAGAQSPPFAFDLLVTNQAPSADASFSCKGLSCSFNGSGSSDSDGSVASYAWDFGDGATGNGVKPSHVYASTGTYHASLAVTDDAGAQSSPFTFDVTVDASSAAQVDFVGHAGFNGNTSNPTVTLPAGISAGDMELLFVTSGMTGITTSLPTGRSGWQQVVQRVNGSMEETLFSRVATAGDSGQTVTVPLASAAKVDLRFVDYSGVTTATPVFAVGVDSATATHVTPAVTVTDPGSWVLSFWSDRTSNDTVWSMPGSVTARGTGYGTGGGRVDAAIADSGGPVSVGTYLGSTASSNATSGKAVMISLVLDAS